MILFCSSGSENPVQGYAAPNGHVIVSPLKVVVSSGEFCVLVTPADCGHDAVLAPDGLFCTQVPAGALATGVPTPWVSTPEVASESLLAMVLLTILTFNESCSDIPPPSQPTMLFTIMLLVIETLFQRDGCPGKEATSVPLTCCRRIPPPLPLSAILPWMRL